jgi:hypothetical protein
MAIDLLGSSQHHAAARQTHTLLRQLPRRKRMTSTEPSIDRPSLPVDIARAVAAQESRHARDLISNTSSGQRVELPDFPLGAPLPCCFIHRGRHTSLDQPRTYCIASDASAGELVGCGLHDADDGCFGGGVVCCAGVGAEAGDGGSGDDTTARVGLGVRCLEHTTTSVLCCQEDARGTSARAALRIPVAKPH